MHTKAGCSLSSTTAGPLPSGRNIAHPTISSIQQQQQQNQLINNNNNQLYFETINEKNHQRIVKRSSEDPQESYRSYQQQTVKPGKRFRTIPDGILTESCRNPAGIPPQSHRNAAKKLAGNQQLQRKASMAKYGSMEIRRGARPESRGGAITSSVPPPTTLTPITIYIALTHSKQEKSDNHNPPPLPPPPLPPPPPPPPPPCCPPHQNR